MADNDNGSENGNEATAAVEIPDCDWDVRLKSLERIETDPEDDDLKDLFAANFTVNGPNANAEVEIMVAETDDVEAVAVGLATLRGALMAWADLIQRRQAGLRAVLKDG